MICLFYFKIFGGYKFFIDFVNFVDVEQVYIDVKKDWFCLVLNGVDFIVVFIKYGVKKQVQISRSLGMNEFVEVQEDNEIVV